MPRASAGPVPVVVMGLGVIGQEIARAAQLSPEVELIGAIDANPQLAGRPLSDVLGVPSLKGKVASTLEAAVGRRKGVVLLHATGSRLEQVMDQLLDALKLGLPVVEKTLQRHDVYSAQECFLTGTAAEVIPVTKVDSRPIGDGKVGPVTRKLIEAFRRMIRES